MIILICGMPATGKSTLAIKLAAELDFKVCIGVDEIKEVVKKYDNNPFLSKSSHDAWQLIGKRTEKNILSGFQKYCQGLKSGVMSIFEKSEKNGENIIIEGIQLLPKLYCHDLQNFNLFYFIIKSEYKNIYKEKIRHKILERHGKQVDVWSEKFREFILIEEEVLKQAERFKCHVLPEKNFYEQIEIIKNIIVRYEII